MQKITGKEITTSKITVDRLRSEIVYHHKQFESARSSVFSAMQLGLWHRWQCGIRLNQAKSVIGHGNWTLWVESNLPFDERTAQRYMKVDSDNAELRSKATELSATKPDLQILNKLREDTIRKHAIGFVPAKDQPQHHGNIKFPRLATLDGIANQFARIKQRYVDGLEEIDFDEAREDCKDLYEFLRWLYGDSTIDAWPPR